MLKHNSGITDTKQKPDDTADKQSIKIHLLYCIRCWGNGTQTATNDKIQWEITKSEHISVLLRL